MMLEESQKWFQAHYSQNSGEAATVLNSMRSAYFICHSFKKALFVYTESLKIQKAALGKEPMEAVATIFNIGLMCCQLGCISDSMQSYRAFIEITKEKCGAERLLTCTYG
jgi:hypothetical protein